MAKRPARRNFKRSEWTLERITRSGIWIPRARKRQTPPIEWFGIDVRELRWLCIYLTNYEIGKLFDDVCRACEHGDVQFVTQFRFVEGYRFVRFGRVPISTEIRRAVWERDGGRCQYCQATEGLEHDHIVPVARGGATTVENIQLLCRLCNRRKGPRPHEVRKEASG